MCVGIGVSDCGLRVNECVCPCEHSEIVTGVCVWSCAPTGPLFLPLASLLLQPWVCSFATPTKTFPTSDCGSALACWSPLHGLVIVASACTLGVAYLSLAATRPDAHAFLILVSE